LPRIARLYITIGIAVIIFLSLILILPKNSEHKTINDINYNNNNYNKFKSINKEFLKKDETNIEFDDQLIKPIDSRVKDNNNNNNNINNINKVDISEEHLVPIIESLSLDIFKQSAQKHQNEEQKAIVNALKHSWNAYRTYAWGADHLRPITKSKDNWFGVGLTLLDSLDTLVMMGLEEGLDFS
jgi:hypothetical protein